MPLHSLGQLIDALRADAVRVSGEHVRKGSRTQGTPHAFAGRKAKDGADGASDAMLVGLPVHVPHWSL